MTGGTVIKTVEHSDKIEVSFITDQYKETHTVFLEKTAAARCIEEDDSLHSNGEYAFWSPKGRYFRDYKLNIVKANIDKKKTSSEKVKSN